MKSTLVAVLLIALMVGGAGCAKPAPPPSSATSPSAPRAVSFSEITIQAGLGGFRHATGAFGKKWMPETTGAGAGFIDYNGDGWLDILLVGGGEWPGHAATPPRALWLYRNNGDGTFSLNTKGAGLSDVSAYGFGITAADYDNDDDQDVFLTTLHENMLFRNDDGVFVEVGRQVGVAGASTWSTAALFFDADRDGDLDVFAANGHVQQEIENVREGVTFRQPPQLFLNQGDGTFGEMKPEQESPLRQPLLARGAAYGDVDRDGDLDLLITENGGGAHLWRNERRSHQASPGPAHALRVALTGRQSNRDGLGGRVVAYVGARRMEQRIRTGASYLSQSEKAITFGLGPATHADSLIVYWPSGRVDRFAGVQGDQAVQVTEGAGTLTQRSFQQLRALTRR